MNPTTLLPHRCPFCGKDVMLWDHVGKCDPEQRPMIPDLSPEEIQSGLVEEAMKLFPVLFQLQTGREPTPAETERKRLQVVDMVRRLK